MYDNTQRGFTCGFRYLAILVAAVALSTNVSAQTLSDHIFESGAEPAMVIEGRIGYPSGLGDAVIEGHVGGHVATTRSRADGSYALSIELQRLTPGSVIELVGFGSGANTHLVWASPIGPSDRLRTLANANGRVTLAEDAFVNLTPRSTAIAGAMRAFNGYARIHDELTFHRAARSYQIHTLQLMYALALVAQGDLALPAGVPNTFSAVTSMRSAQELYAAYSLVPYDCDTSPPTPSCALQTTFGDDPAVVPLRPFEQNRWFSRYLAFSTSADVPGTGNTDAVMITGSTTARLIVENSYAVDATLSTMPNGNVRLVRADGLPIREYEYYATIDGNQIRVSNRTMAMHLRATNGPGGSTELGLGYEQYLIEYDNPGNIITTFPVHQSPPQHMSGAPLPADLLAQVPTLSGKTFVLPLATAFGPANPLNWDGAHGYDLHVFASASTGHTLRTGASFSYSVASDGTFALEFGNVTATYRFVNEEESGVWRISAHAIGAGREASIDGLILQTDASMAFNPADLAGEYTMDIIPFRCSGPQPGMDALTAYANCGRPNYRFLPGGSILYPSGANWGTWGMGSAAFAGRLLLEHNTSGNYVQFRRGWQKVRDTGDEFWVLENVNAASGGVVAPVTFSPTIRLTRGKRAPL